MSFQMQQQIKRNAEQIRSYVTDLYDWQQQMQLKQKAKSKLLKQQRLKQQQMARQKQLQQKQQQKQKQSFKNQVPQNTQEQPKPDLIRDTNTIKDYYNAWDKFNVNIDDQLKRLQQQQTRAYRPYNPYENSQNYIRARPKAKVNIKIQGKRAAVIDPTQLKDKGNLHYKVCEYEKAIDAYSQCIQKLRQLQQNHQNNKLKCVVLSNRAMTYMKLNQRAKALQDCNQSILYDPLYVKSYLRRADCHKKLRNYRESLRDYKKVKQLDREEKDVDVEIKKIEMYLEKLFKQARESLIVKNMANMGMRDSWRVQIQEVDELDNIMRVDQAKMKQKVNYLEEL